MVNGTKNGVEFENTDIESDAGLKVFTQLFKDSLYSFLFEF